MACLDDSSLPFLHGTLVIRIEEAKDLPDLDRLVVASIISFLLLFEYIVSSWWHSSKNVTDAFVKVELFPVGVKVAETKVRF